MSQQQNGNPTPEQIRQTAENWASAWSQHDSEKYADLYAPDSVYRDPAFGAELRGGRLAHIFGHDSLKQAVPSFDVTIKEILIGDNHATVVFSGDGIMTKPNIQLPPESNGYGVFVAEGDVVKLEAGSKTLVFNRGQDGHFDLSPLPKLPDSAVGKNFAIPNGVAVLKVDESGLITEATNYYNMLPLLIALGLSSP